MRFLQHKITMIRINTTISITIRPIPTPIATGATHDAAISQITKHNKLLISFFFS